MVFHTGTILRASATDQHDRMLLYIMACNQPTPHIISHLTSLSPPPPRKKHTNTNTPSPGMYAVTTLSLLKRTLATFRSAELGFLGFMTVTLRHTAFMHGFPDVDMAGETGLRAGCACRAPRITWLKVARGAAEVAKPRRERGRRRGRGNIWGGGCGQWSGGER